MLPVTPRLQERQGRESIIQRHETATFGNAMSLAGLKQAAMDLGPS